MCFVQYKKCERESLVASEQKNDNYEDADKNEDNDSSVEWENDDRFNFVRSIPDDDPATNWGILESEKRSSAARSEHERVSANWMEYKVPWRKIHNKR